MIDYQRIFYSYFSGHQFSDYASDEEDVEGTIDLDREVHDQRSFNGFLKYIDDVYRRGMAVVRPIYDKAMLGREFSVYGDYENMPPSARPRRERVTRDRAAEEADRAAEEAKEGEKYVPKEDCIIS